MVITSEYETESTAIELDRAQCLDLLRTTSVGRVVLSIQCIPVALAVSITMLDDELLIATDRRSRLKSDVDSQVVSIQADEFDPTTRTAWSVLVTGTAEVETDPDESAAAGSRLCWLPGPDPLLVRVFPILTSGRRFEWSGKLLGAGG